MNLKANVVMNDNDYFRQKTRLERILDKQDSAVKLPFSISTINLDLDENLALLIRAAACFGAKEFLVIGKVPPRSFLQPKTGSLVDFVDIKSFANPLAYMSYIRENNIQIVSAEKYDEAVDLRNYKFSFDRETTLVLGHETLGVPLDILINSDVVCIASPGVGFTLNVAQAGAIVMYEYVAQYLNEKNYIV